MGAKDVRTACLERGAVTCEKLMLIVGVVWQQRRGGGDRALRANTGGGRLGKMYGWYNTAPLKSPPGIFLLHS